MMVDAVQRSRTSQGAKSSSIGEASSEESARTFTVLSCFSGAGGLDLGLEAAGFETVGCLELDAAASATLAANRSDWPLLQPADVVVAGDTLSPLALGMSVGELDLIAGGPPCQPFSKAAQWAAPKKGITDDRGNAVRGMLGLVESFLPRAVLMENVAGFLAGNNNARQVIEAEFVRINALHGTKYSLANWTVDAADYGVPQHRRRAILIAFRDGIDTPRVLPATHVGDHRTAWDALGEYEPPDAAPASGGYADLLPSIPEGSNYQFLTARGGGPEWELFGYRTRFWSFLLKLAKDRPAWTIPASPGPSTGPFHWRNRPLTAKERLLLQGFPEQWHLAGDVRSNVKLAGNATPPPLAEALGRLIKDALEQHHFPDEVLRAQEGLSLATKKRNEPVPEAAEPRRLADRWAARVCSRDAHPGTGLGPTGYALNLASTGDLPDATAT